MSRYDHAKEIFRADMNGVPVEIMALYSRAIIFIMGPGGKWREFRNTPPDDSVTRVWGYHDDTQGRVLWTMKDLLSQLYNRRPFVEIAKFSEVKDFAAAFNKARSCARDFCNEFPRCLTGDERMHISGLYKEAKQKHAESKTDKDWDDVIAYGGCLHPVEFLKWAKRQPKDEYMQNAIARAEAFLDPGE